MFREAGGEDLLHFVGENEIEIADSLYAVRDEVDDDFIPYVEPLGVVIHRFGDERDSRHVAECGDEILALVLAVKFSILHGPAGKPGHELGDFVVGELARLHKGPPERWGYLLWYAQGMGATIARAQKARSDGHCEREANPLS